jgi:Smg protein
MKENILDVLMYLFENYMNDEIEFDSDEESLRSELQAAGFHSSEISKAFDWLEGLAEMQDKPYDIPLNVNSIRVYTESECEKLDLHSRGFIQFLEQTGVLDHTTREMVIDRVMALESDEFDLDQLKWVVLMVLFNQPGQEAAFAWMEDLVFDEAVGRLH